MLIGFFNDHIFSFARFLLRCIRMHRNEFECYIRDIYKRDSIMFIK